MGVYANQLASVRAAIVEIESGAQSAELPDGQKVEKADLKTLYVREDRLVGLAAREARGASGGRVRRVEIG